MKTLLVLSLTKNMVTLKKMWRQTQTEHNGFYACAIILKAGMFTFAKNSLQNYFLLKLQQFSFDLYENNTLGQSSSATSFKIRQFIT